MPPMPPVYLLFSEDPMGVKELRDSFNLVVAGQATCTKALMETLPAGGQMLYFGGSYADGEGWVIQSKLIPPQADLVAASRETAEALLQRARAI